MPALVAPAGHSPWRRELGGCAHSPCLSDIEHGLILSAQIRGQSSNLDTLRVLEENAVAEVGV